MIGSSKTYENEVLAMESPEIFKDFDKQIADAAKLANLHTYHSVDVNQFYNDTCAIRSQQLILRKFGIDIPQEKLMEEAAENGWYTPGQGTPGTAVGKLLAAHGVDASLYQNANLHDLHDMLAQGRQCIVMVDANELWSPDSKWHFLKEKVLGIESANHALIVTDVIGDPDNPALAKVVVTDPGTGEVAKIYSGDQFLDAHRDSNFSIVSTDQPLPSFVDTFGQGHLISFGRNDNPTWWDNWAKEYGEVLDEASGVPIVPEAPNDNGGGDDGTAVYAPSDDCETGESRDDLDEPSSLGVIDGGDLYNGGDETAGAATSLLGSLT